MIVTSTGFSEPNPPTSGDVISWKEPITSDEQLRACLTAAYPLLRYVHDKEKIVDFPIINDTSEEYKIASLMPYYMNSYDPYNIGVWGLRVEGQNDIRITATPDRRGEPEFKLTQKHSNNGEEFFLTLTPNEADVYVRSLLRLAQSEAFQAAQNQMRAPMHNGWLKRFLGVGK